MPNRDATRLAFHGGVWGAVAPMLLFLSGVIALALAGAPDERGFWPVLVAALALGTALACDRRAYAETAIAGMSQPIVLLMVVAWLLAGMLAVLLTSGGLVGALVDLASGAGLAGGAWAATAFLIAALVSTATGTSLGTLLLCGPLLYPAGAALAAEPVVLLGAILGGATFGDNISPISDTTIASATTQGAEIGAVVRTRLRYALPAAALAITFYAVAGGAGRPAGAEPAAAAAAAVETAAPAADRSSAAALPLLAVPALVVALLLARRHLLEGLLAGIAAAVAIGLLCGLFAPSDLLYIDADAFGARGLLVAGMERGIGVSVFTFLLMGLVSGLEAAGVTGRLVAGFTERARTPRGAETASFATISAAVVLTTHSVVALLAVGGLIRRAGERFGLSPERRANLLDVAVCTWPFLLPYCIPTILAASVTAGAPGMPRLTPLAAGLWNAHSWALLAVLLFAIATGWGRRRTAAERRG